MSKIRATLTAIRWPSTRVVGAIGWEARAIIEIAADGSYEVIEEPRFSTSHTPTALAGGLRPARIPPQVLKDLQDGRFGEWNDLEVAEDDGCGWPLSFEVLPERRGK